MKDYYYILGITRLASQDEIKTAYRKLSTKFHPDKNGGDTFFEERFKEIQEAYETLSRPDRRTNYDQAYKQRANQSGPSNGSTPPKYTNFYPTIETFTASPIKIYDGDEVEFSWNVFNADSIRIEKIGIVPASGKKRIKISGLRSAKSINVTLSAINTHIGKSENRSIQIFNQAYEDIEKEVYEKENVDRNTKLDTKELDNEMETIFKSIVGFIFLFLILFVLFSLFV